MVATSAYLPTSGSYTLKWAIVPGLTAGGAAKAASASGTSTVTYGTNTVTITLSNGTTKTYTYIPGVSDLTKTTIWGSQLGNPLMMFKATDGTCIVLADPADIYGRVPDLNTTYQLLASYTMTINNGTGGQLLANWDKAWLAVCFLAGTMMSTPSGHVAVEDIKPGMEVLTFDKEGHAVTKKVQWVGKEKVSRNRSDINLEKAPVRIIKDAIAPNVPFKDCLITPEHCLYLEGCFVPVRMLVNNKSIYYDTSFVEYEYFHVELEDHSILQSDGLFSESYLKTSDRDFSSYEGRPSMADKTWEKDAAAPLNVSAEFVEPLYHQLSARADEIQGSRHSMNKIHVTSDPFLMDKDGNQIFASKVSGNKHVFHVENLSDAVMLFSHSASPSELIGPFVDDRRKFGLLIGEISISTTDEVIPYKKHLEDEEISGWHGLDLAHGAHRWTDGHAEISGLGTHKNCSIHIEIKDQTPTVL